MEAILIDEYMLLSLDDRQKHIKADEECIERGGSSTHHKGVLAQFLNTHIPSSGVDLCHYCGNGKCSNPHHLYWGTRRENIDDSKRHGTYINVWDKLVNKYGYEEACKMNASRGHQVGNDRAKVNKNKSKTDQHKQKISESVKKLHDDGHYHNVQSGRKKNK